MCFGQWQKKPNVFKDKLKYELCHDFIYATNTSVCVLYSLFHHDKTSSNKL